MKSTFQTSATIGEVAFYVKEIFSPAEKPAAKSDCRKGEWPYCCLK
jgi:hypothetical protein